MLRKYGRVMPDVEMNKRLTVEEIVDFYALSGEKQTTGVEKLELDLDKYGDNVTVEPFWKDLKKEGMEKEGIEL